MKSRVLPLSNIVIGPTKPCDNSVIDSVLLQVSYTVFLYNPAPVHGRNVRESEKLQGVAALEIDSAVAMNADDFDLLPAIRARYLRGSDKHLLGLESEFSVVSVGHLW